MKSYEIPIEPMGAPRMTRADSWKKRPVVLRYRKYKDDIRKIIGKVDIPDKVELLFIFPMPASWSKKKRLAMKGQLHRSKPDIDNCEKAIYDTLWPENDAGVAHAESKKVWSNFGCISIRLVY